MEFLFKIILGIHITAGSIGLISGTINSTRKKGDALHKKMGKCFFYSMLVNGFAGLILSILHVNYFLFIIAVFTLYLVITGQRFLSLKELTKGQKPKFIDWTITWVMFVFSILFLTYGIYLIIKTINLGFVLLIFGLISILMVLKDFKVYKGHNITIENYWLLIHIQRMTGAYIASTTAFLVVNNSFLPEIVAWLLPTIILTPFIFRWSYKYKTISKKTV